MLAPIVDAEGSRLRAIGEHVPQLRELGIAVLFHEPGDVVAAAPAAGLALDRQGRDAEDPRACARGLSSEAFAALEFGVQDLQPVPARPATIAAAGPLRHDPLEASLQAWTNTIAPSVARASLNTTPSTPRTSSRKRISPLFQRALAEIKRYATTCPCI